MKKFNPTSASKSLPYKLYPLITLLIIACNLAAATSARLAQLPHPNSIPNSYPAKTEVIDITSLKLAPASEDDVGLIVWDPATDSLIVAHNAQQKFLYASNIKLFTSAACLERLGGGKRFTTRFCWHAADSTLYIKGGGDPSTVQEDLYNAALELHERGMGQVKQMVYDDSLFAISAINTPDDDDDPLDRAYLAKVTGLNLNYNGALLTVRPGQPNQPPLVYARTPGLGLNIVNTATNTGNRRAKLQVASFADSCAQTTITIQGDIYTQAPRPKRYVRRVYNPGYVYAAAVAQMCGYPNAQLKAAVIADSLLSTADNRVRWWMRSEPLRDVLRLMNVHSSNPIANALGAHLALADTSACADSINGATAVSAWVQDSLHFKLNLEDTSGLGKTGNFVTPAQLKTLMAYVWHKPMLAADFYGSLPVYGQEGTLIREWGFNGDGLVRAKSGMVDGVTALSGLMQGASGRVYLFTLVVNNYPMHQRIDRITWRNRVVKQLWERL